MSKICCTYWLVPLAIKSIISLSTNSKYVCIQTGNVWWNILLDNSFCSECKFLLRWWKFGLIDFGIVAELYSSASSSVLIASSIYTGSQSQNLKSTISNQNHHLKNLHHSPSRLPIFSFRLTFASTF